MQLSELSVGKNHLGEYAVMANGIPMGAMQNFYQFSTKIPLALARNRYPFSSEKNSYPEESMAQSALVRTQAHVSAVIDMNDKLKIGSSKYWTR